MRKLIGALIIIGGIALGVYVGFWIMFVGGIMSIATAFHFGTLTAIVLAWNIIKIICAGFVGWLIFYIGCIIGTFIGD